LQIKWDYRKKKDLVGVQEVKWEGGDTKLSGEYTFFFGKRNEDHELGMVSMRKRIM
jgi:hypothetical protein